MYIVALLKRERDINGNESKTMLKKKDTALDAKATALDCKEPLLKSIKEGQTPPRSSH
jgi:hypothetical protein